MRYKVWLNPVLLVPIGHMYDAYSRFCSYLNFKNFAKKAKLAVICLLKKTTELFCAGRNTVYSSRYVHFLCAILRLRRLVLFVLSFLNVLRNIYLTNKSQKEAILLDKACI